MYNKNKVNDSSIIKNESYVGESIEKRVNRLVYNQESIGDGAPLIYTDRRNGVQPEYNIRTDRFEMAIESMDKVHTENLGKRVEMYNPKPEITGDATT